MLRRLYSYSFFVICQYFCIFSIGQKSFVLLKYASKWIKQLAISRIVYLSSLSFISQMFKTLVFPVTVTGQPDSAASLTFLCTSKIAFSSYKRFHKIPYQIHNFPLSNLNLHYRMTQFCILKFYISSSFQFSRHF